MIEFDIYGKYQDIALVKTKEMLIYDEESALNLIKIVKEGVNCHKFIISKSCVDNAFFLPNTLYTGRVLQKFISSHIQIAIVGDYSCLIGQPAYDFIHQINKGDRIFFTDSMDKALERLAIDI